jgi:tetratricopeptide (TPR) repeat protein
MPEITFDESCRQIESISERVHRNEKQGDWAAALAGLNELLRHPCAHHQIVPYEVWGDIHEVHKKAGNFDDAIVAMEEAVRLGYRSVPDPDTDIAECHLRAGRRSEADVLLADVKARNPDDVWLYNAAGYSYAWVEEHTQAAQWFREGVDVALRTGDPDQVVIQLLEGLENAWSQLGQDSEQGLKGRVEAFTKSWVPPSRPTPVGWDNLPQHEDRPCAYCGYQPDRSWAEREERRRRSNRQILEQEMPEALARLEALPSYDHPTRLAGAISLSVAWFTAGQWERAIEMWPDLLDELPSDHLDYSHRIEARIKRITRLSPGHTMHVSPMTVEALTAFSDEHERDPATPEARSAYAAELSRRGEAVPWPPGRNSPCWCRSGRKYKSCCGSVPPATE